MNYRPNKPNSRLGYPLLLLLLAITLSFMLTTHQVTAEVSLFQSPPETEEEEAPPTETPTPEPTATPEPTLTFTPPPPDNLPTAMPSFDDPAGGGVPPLPPPDLPPPPLATEEEGRGNFIFDRAEFIDTAIITASWVWLCCGIIFFLSIPLFVLLLQIRGRSLLRKQQDGA